MSEIKVERNEVVSVGFKGARFGSVGRSSLFIVGRSDSEDVTLSPDNGKEPILIALKDIPKLIEALSVVHEALTPKAAQGQGGATYAAS